MQLPIKGLVRVLVRFEKLTAVGAAKFGPKLTAENEAFHWFVLVLEEVLERGPGLRASNLSYVMKHAVSQLLPGRADVNVAQICPGRQLPCCSIDLVDQQSLARAPMLESDLVNAPHFHGALDTPLAGEGRDVLLRHRSGAFNGAVEVKVVQRGAVGGIFVQELDEGIDALGQENNKG